MSETHDDADIAVRYTTRLLTAILWERGEITISKAAFESVPEDLVINIENGRDCLRLFFDPIDETIRQVRRP